MLIYNFLELNGTSWLAVQGLVKPIAYFSLIVYILMIISKCISIVKMKGGVSMNNKFQLVNIILESISTMSANIAGSALLAKVLH